MISKTVLIVLIALIILPFTAIEKAIAQTNRTDFKVLVLIVPSKNFKSKYQSRYYRSKYKGGTTPYYIQDDLVQDLEKKLGSHRTGGLWQAVICKTSAEFNEKAAQPDAYLGMKVEILERKYTSKSTRYKYRSYSELKVSCEVHRKTGMSWQKVFAKTLKTKSSDPKKEEYYITSTDRMVEYLDRILIDRMVQYQVINAMAKDANTKLVNVTVMNTAPFPIKRLKWVIPLENENLSAESDVMIRPGERKNITFSVRSERSHASFQWRNATSSDIEFTRSDK